MTMDGAISQSNDHFLHLNIISVLVLCSLTPGIQEHFAYTLRQLVIAGYGLSASPFLPVLTFNISCARTPQAYTPTFSNVFNSLSI